MRSVLELGVHPNDILFANPCKAASTMMFAAKAGISMTTFDNHSELDNIKAFMPDARLLLRVFANDKTAVVTLGDKYGAPCCSVESLLQKACALNLKVIGTSFHIGNDSISMILRNLGRLICLFPRFRRF
jgi:ornithine decarboxylase